MLAAGPSGFKVRRWPSPQREVGARGHFLGLGRIRFCATRVSHSSGDFRYRRCRWKCCRESAKATFPANASGGLRCPATTPIAVGFFEVGTLEGRLKLDLGKSIALDQVETYSRHKGSRAPQLYTLYASDGSRPHFDPSPRIGTDPVAHGWTRIATVDTRPQIRPGRGVLYGQNLQQPGCVLGNLRYLLFEMFPTENPGPVRPHVLQRDSRVGTSLIRLSQTRFCCKSIRLSPIPRCKSHPFRGLLPSVDGRSGRYVPSLRRLPMQLTKTAGAIVIGGLLIGCQNSHPKASAPAGASWFFLRRANRRRASADLSRLASGHAGRIRQRGRSEPADRVGGRHSFRTGPHRFDHEHSDQRWRNRAGCRLRPRRRIRPAPLRNIRPRPIRAGHG